MAQFLDDYVAQFLADYQIFLAFSLSNKTNVAIKLVRFSISSGDRPKKMKRYLVPLCFAAMLLSSAWYVQADEEDDEDEGKKKDKDGVGTVIGIDLGTTYSW